MKKHQLTLQHIFATLIFFTCVPMVWAQTEISKATPKFLQKNLQEIDVFIQDEIRERQIPGLQIAIVKDKKLVMLKSYGLANLQHRVPTSNYNLFSINSATKSFTGVAIMQLVQQGKIDLSAPVPRYINNLPVAWQPMTITQLLTHTSGIPDVIKTSKITAGDDPEAAWQLV